MHFYGLQISHDLMKLKGWIKFLGFREFFKYLQLTFHNQCVSTLSHTPTALSSHWGTCTGIVIGHAFCFRVGKRESANPSHSGRAGFGFINQGHNRTENMGGKQNTMQKLWNCKRKYICLYFKFGASYFSAHCLFLTEWHSCKGRIQEV